MAESFYLAPGQGLVQALTGTDLVPRKAHAGLVWDRYFPIWEGSPDDPRRGKRARMSRNEARDAVLRDRLKDFVADFNARGDGPRNPARDLLREHRERIARALDAVQAARRDHVRQVSFRTLGRLATGLGGDHPTENGFAFDATIGVPYLTGSAVKGLCRRAAWYDGMPELETGRLFGPEQVRSGGSAGRGTLRFFDAYPRRWPHLEVDLVNCHHRGYYGSGGGRPPLETDSPVPVFFLALAPETELVFPLLAPDEADLDTAERLLRLGHDLLGIGAKTACGYGLMTPAPPDPGRRQLGRQ